VRDFIDYICIAHGNWFKRSSRRSLLAKWHCVISLLHDAASAFGRYFGHFISNLQQFDLKVQIGIGRNDTIPRAFAAVGVVGRNVQHCLFAERHCHDAFVPALDDLPRANFERERYIPITTAVKLFAVGYQRSSVAFSSGSMSSNEK
jgi:hypothetical protein